MAKIYKVSGYFIDPNGETNTQIIKTFLENGLPFETFPTHLNIDEKDIGYFEEDSLLNQLDCPKCECDKYFMED